ncbi:hypothetical protein HC031_20380 [Planosporangium thailandense]|uniref:YkuD domain-containing protein n=1 Tax=Planosporangium thailandense TaxID=765197 RepID=A0ABX0Y3T4_9ACTN|nr:hypothetical protein [Planosporangium thailandense]NJC72054.1 hypothetical protein [Planosporangium thailandense]
MRKVFTVVWLVGLVLAEGGSSGGLRFADTAGPIARAASSGAPLQTVLAGTPSPSPSPSATASPAPSPSPSPSPSRSTAPTVKATRAPIPPAVLNEGPKWLMTKVPAASRQAVVVEAASTGTSYAKLSAFQRTTGGGWHRVLGPVSARIGSSGFSWSHREGVPSTPIGVFALPLAFGWANPGTRMAWRTATTDSVWVDDPTSAYYDTWQTAPANGRWKSAEQLHIPVYQLALWININPSHTPNAGSAFFVHLANGGATAGCVAVDESSLRWLLGWMDPAAGPRIVMGPGSTLNQ